MIALSDVAELNMLVARSEQHDLFMLSLSEDVVIVKENRITDKILKELP